MLPVRLAGSTDSSAASRRWGWSVQRTDPGRIASARREGERGLEEEIGLEPLPQPQTEAASG